MSLAVRDRRSAKRVQRDAAEELRMVARAVAALRDGDSLTTLAQRFPARVVKAARELAQPQSSCTKA